MALLRRERDSLREGQRFVLLGDVVKAFETVDPAWILGVLEAYDCPVWVVAIAFLLIRPRRLNFKFGRRREGFIVNSYAQSTALT